ncbi:MAG: hypothetical protein WCT03_21920 [Candidatus Obscuribacterales bacterium]
MQSSRGGKRKNALILRQNLKVSTGLVTGKEAAHHTGVCPPSLYLLTPRSGIALPVKSALS